MTELATGICVRPMTAEDESAVQDLLSFGSLRGRSTSRSRALYGWKYQSNPFGGPLAVVAEDGGQIVAAQLLMRWDLDFEGIPVRGAWLTDRAADLAHQHRGLGNVLTADLVDEVLATGTVDLVLQRHGSAAPSGWSRVRPLRVHVAPARLVHLGARTVARVAGRPDRTCTATDAGCPFESARDFLDRRGPEVAALVAGARRPAGLATRRTPGFLRWRYGDAPGPDYRCVSVEDGTGLRGVGFGRLRQRGWACEFALSDIVVRAGDTHTARNLLSLARRSGADHAVVRAVAGTELHKVAASSGYLPVPRRGLGLSAHLGADLPVDPRRARAWCLTLGDLEVL